jgi:FKBP-type peptidyl-prolyl cis-trans isomerase FkpA
MQKAKFVFFIAITLLVVACKKDDGGDIIRVPPRALDEVAAEDEAAIQEYLATHFYNYDEFESPPADFDFRIRLDTIAGSNSDKRPLAEDIQSVTIAVSTDEFLLSAEQTVNHKLYYLVAREGAGASPTVADSAYVRYRGSLLNGTVFDGALTIPTWFDLAALQGPQQGVRGFTEVMPFLKTGSNVVENPDGTFSVEGYGVGMVIIPSGLGYFNVSQGNIPAYSPLIFTLDLFTINPADHDGDGIPSILEDVNGDGYLYNDNTDEAQERASGSFLRFMNYLDADDDNDDTLTIDEITLDAEGNLVLPFPDGDNDGIPDHLDRDTP